ncbi:hypothetical protein [Rubrobacter indicoceani]|uniref:hypothetical protein n=1 Tax=Rubrobacter indicoceani TaxID=2051957 RepID=UPI0013C44C89|nr:hypothetical protein [Rubrobacter indicoceani]
MERGEVCLEQTVERLYEEGKTPAGIAEVMGVDVGWVETLVAGWADEPEADQASTSAIE